MAQSLLVDVRTPDEFATGYLDGAINIEYQNIDQLASRPGVSRADSITLYCRSGRRSGIALETLRGMGFEKVRDIGSLEQARETLQREKEEADTAGLTQPASPVSKESLQKSTQTLVDGLKALE